MPPLPELPPTKSLVPSLLLLNPIHKALGSSCSSCPLSPPCSQGAYSPCLADRSISVIPTSSQRLSPGFFMLLPGPSHFFHHTHSFWEMLSTLYLSSAKVTLEILIFMCNASHFKILYTQVQRDTATARCSQRFASLQALVQGMLAARTRMHPFALGRLWTEEQHLGAGIITGCLTVSL